MNAAKDHSCPQQNCSPVKLPNLNFTHWPNPLQLPLLLLLLLLSASSRIIIPLTAFFCMACCRNEVALERSDGALRGLMSSCGNKRERGVHCAVRMGAE